MTSHCSLQRRQALGGIARDPSRICCADCVITSWSPRIRLSVGLSLMSFRIFFVLMLLSSVPAYAEWLVVGTSTDDDMIYIDPATIRQKGELVEVWVLFDSRLAKRFLETTSYYASTRQLQQYNCTEEQYRSLTVTWFSSNMGKGTVVDNLTKEGQWQPVPPGSVGRYLMNLVCAKR
jgi:hypothetical protein